MDLKDYVEEAQGEGKKAIKGMYINEWPIPYLDPYQIDQTVRSWEESTSIG